MDARAKRGEAEGRGKRKCNRWGDGLYRHDYLLSKRLTTAIMMMAQLCGEKRRRVSHGKGKMK